MSPGKETEETDTENTSTEKTKIPSTKPAAKRRTKTGCLTCRKRRIKCGEEKPHCKNCIKSKRDCAGYVQPLVYKNQGGQSAAHDSTNTATISEHNQFQFNTAINHNLISAHQPPYNPFVDVHQHPEIHYKSYGSQHWTQQYQYPIPEPSNPNINISPTEGSQLSRRHSEQAHSGSYPRHYPPYFEPYGSTHHPGWSHRAYSLDTQTHSPFAYPEPEPASALTTPYEPYPYSGSQPPDARPLHELRSKRYDVHGFLETSNYGSNMPSLPQPSIQSEWTTNVSDHEEDLSDTQMENDGSLEPQDEVTQPKVPTRTRGSNTPTSGNLRNTKSTAVRTIRPKITFSPLQDERNQHIFSHFVQVTGSCMTIFERSSSAPWSMPSRTLWGSFLPTMAVSNAALAYAILALGGLHIAKLQQTQEDYSLKHFTYALRRVGKLLGQPERRHDVATLATVLLLGFYEVMAADHSRWTLHLAGAMKLVAEHDFSSSTHRIRAMQSRVKRNISRLKQASAPDEASYFDIAGIPPLDENDWDVDRGLISNLVGFDVDERNVLQPLLTEQTSMIDMNDQEITNVRAMMDLRWWYCKQDIFQSMVSGDQLLMPYEKWPECPPRGRIGIASIAYASFDHLLLLLARLSDFGGKDRLRKQRVIAAQGGQWRPPVAQHERKRSEVNDQTVKHGMKEPTKSPSTNVAPSEPTATTGFVRGKTEASPTANEGRARQSKPTPQGPTFHGMMPPPEAPVTMLPSFHKMNDQLNSRSVPQQTNRKPSLKPDLNTATSEAVAEHSAIREAFDLFACSLGPDFDPLPANESIQSSPFGPALRYQSPTIACIWLHYNVGRILLHRLHPSMPPAAMVAAGVAAQHTKTHAQNVGKICSGLYSSTPGNPNEPLDPTYAGALIESTFTLLFAGVQYQDISQRGWTISKLHDIARMTGWQTSASIAAACEIAWEKMGQAGRGPPYSRSLDRSNEDARVNGMSRSVYPEGVDRHLGTPDAKAEHESQFVRHDRSLIGKHSSTRVHWALGLLSVEEDIKKLNIE